MSPRGEVSLRSRATFPRMRARVKSDTSADARRVLVEGLRRMSPAEKLARVVALNRSVELMARAGIKLRYPDADESEVRIRLARMWLSDEDLRAIVGRLPDDG